MVTDWYNEWVGTEYEGCSMPGSIANTRAITIAMPLCKTSSNLLHGAALDTNGALGGPPRPSSHGRYGARSMLHLIASRFVLTRSLSGASWLVWFLATSWKSRMTGILNEPQFGWGHFGYHWITNHHNIAGMLTESVSAKLATSLHRTEPVAWCWQDYASMPSRLTSLILVRWLVAVARHGRQQKVAAWALLDVAAATKTRCFGTAT